MNKGRRLILFMTCLILGIGLFMIYTMTITIDRDAKSIISQLSKTPKNAVMKSNSDSGSINITSRGTRNKDTDYRENQIENVPVNPTSDPVAQAAPTEEVKSAAPSALAEVKSEAVARSAQARTATAPAPEAATDPEPKAAPAAPAPKAAQAAPEPAAPAPKAAPAPEAVDEVDLLARLITAEAQGEPYEAKVAVGAVVINRVQSGVWANTIEAVIYQRINGYYQFTPVQNGWINKPAESESIKAALAALSGADPTNGAQFYYDDKATNAWILAKPVSVQIGHMIYAF
ncbi:MAG TPA: cell wall hydrolase [Anaerovoracaceae bacterium]|nr:cell wall hydrolase [Anaerovoracaceae bacterium]